MEGFQTFYTILATVVVVFVKLTLADSEYMITNPETITIPYNYETKLTCEMNIDPDKFVWKFYPSNDSYNAKANISLSTSLYEYVSQEKYSKQRRKSALALQVKEKDVGEYQCLAMYGAYVVASVPWRITLATMKEFPYQKDVDVAVTVGNIVSWMCEPPESNPEAYIDYFKDNNNKSLFNKTINNLLILRNVSVQDSGVYKCKATNTATSPAKISFSKAALKLKVVPNASQRAPYFIVQPKKTYTVIKGDSVFLECSAVGNPVPNVYWFKKNGQLPPVRAEMVSGGLQIKNVSISDDGVYECNYTNSLGTASQLITLSYIEEPSVECFLNNTDVKQGENLDMDCTVKGTPEPQISWFLNGYSVNNDKTIEAVGNKIYFRPVEKRHAGNLQCFARNSIGTVYSSISIRVIPLSSSIDVSIPPAHNHHKHGKPTGTRKPNKPPKMIPPSKPIISRLNDNAVVVRWNVPSNNGLPIQFFKVQYRELGPATTNEHHGRGKASRWKTTNADIAPNIKDYDVTGLKSDHIYKFRIAAVYSNNDNKLSQNSDKFNLRRLDFDEKNPLPIPLITNAETVNDTSFRIYWTYIPVPNITVDGFYISYISASTAGDYMKATVDGESTKSYIISHLLPDTFYDVKLQSFTSKFASEFSSIMKAKTAASPATQSPSTMPPPIPTPSSESSGISQLYIIIAGCVIVVGLLIFGVVLFVCRKWQRSKSSDKPTVEEHHIQADGNEYVVGPKPQQRGNGCVLSPSRMTITSNPLADADNKNQNMMEMSCLTSQNNNFASDTQPSVSRQESPSNSNEKNKHKNRDTNKLNKQSVESSVSRENYV